MIIVQFLNKKLIFTNPKGNYFSQFPVPWIDDLIHQIFTESLLSELGQAAMLPSS